MPEEFVTGLSVDDLFTVDKSFISEEFLKRESDLIYRVRRGEHEVYIYILLEFQSTPDKTIAARLLSYIMRLYESFLLNSKAGKLPAVFPMVLYNGMDEWRVPENIADLIEHTIADGYIPHFRFFKIIERDIPDEVLFELNNLIAAVIYLEKQRKSDQLETAVGKVVDMIRNEGLMDVKQFAVWATRMMTFKDRDRLIDGIKEIWEVKPMLTQLAEQLRAEGKVEGKVEGKREGWKEGQKEIAKKLRARGFGVQDIVAITTLSQEEVEGLDQ